MSDPIMPIFPTTGTTGTVQYRNLETGKNYQSAAEMAADIAGEQEEASSSFIDSIQSAISNQFGTTKYETGMPDYLGQNTNFQDTASSIFSSAYDTIVNALYSNQNLFGMTDPKMANEIAKNAADNGFNPGYYLSLSDDLKKDILKEAKIQNENPAWESFVAEHPALSTWLANPINYAQAHDDTKNLGVVAGMTKAAINGAMLSSLQKERGSLYMLEMNGNELSQEQLDRIKLLNATINKMKKAMPKEAWSATGVASGLGGVFQSLGGAAEGAAKGAVAGAVIGTAFAGVGAVPGAIYGATRGAMARFLYDDAIEKAGNMYGDIKEKTGKKATAGAVTYGAINTILNSFSLGAATNAFRTIENSGILKRIGVTTLENSYMAFVTGSADYIAQEGVRRTYGIGDTQTWGELLYSAAMSGVDAIPTQVAMATPGMAWVGFHQMGRKIDESKLKSRDKEIVASAINAQTRGTILQTVNVKPEAVAEIMKNPDITDEQRQDFLRIVPRPENLDIALQTGADIPIDAGTFLTLGRDIREALMPDAKIAGQDTPREYQEAFDDMQNGEVSVQNGDLIASLGLNENPDFVKSVNEEKAKVKAENEKLSSNPKIEKEISAVKEEVKQALDKNPIYKALDAVNNTFKEFSFDLQAFAKNPDFKDLKSWAKAHVKNLTPDQVQAVVDQIAIDNGFSSGAKLIKELAKAPTRDEVYTSVVDATRKRLNSQQSTAPEMELDGLMRQATVASSVLKDVIDGKHIGFSSKADLDKATQNLTNLKATKMMSDEGKSIRNERVKILENQISDIKKQEQQKRKELRERLSEKYKERLDKTKQKAKESKEKQKEKYEERISKKDQKIQEYRDKLKQEHEEIKAYNKAKKLEKKKAKEGALTVTRAKLLAHQNLANLPLYEATNTSPFRLDIMRESKLANRAFEKGDYFAAIEHNNRFISAVAHLSEAYKIQKAARSIDYQIRKIGRYKDKAWGNEEAMNQAHIILNKMGVGNFRITGNPMPLRDWVAQVQAQTGALNLPDFIYSDILSPDMLTLSQYKELKDALQNIRRAGIAQMQYKLNAKKQDRFKLMKGMFDSVMSRQPKYNPNDRESIKNGLIQNYTQSLMNIGTWLTKIDKDLEGTWTKFWRDDHNICQATKSKLDRQYKDEFDKLDGLYKKDELASMQDKNICIEELGDITVSKSDLIGLALSYGCKDNRIKLFSFNTYERADGTVTKFDNIPEPFIGAKNWDRNTVSIVLGKYLDSRDWDYVEGHYAIFDKLWSEHVEPFEYEHTGFHPQKAEAEAFDVTLADGKTTRHIKGGYFPLARDTRTNPLVADDTSMLTQSLNEFDSKSRASMMTRQGHLEKRTSANYTVRIDPMLSRRYVQQVSTDIAFRDWVYMARGIITNRDILMALRSRYGEGAESVFTGAILNTVGNDLTSQLTTDSVNSVHRYLKHAFNASVVSLNPGILIQNLGNIALYPNAIKGWGYTDTITALIKYGVPYWTSMFTNKNAFVAFKSQNLMISEFLKDREQNPDYIFARKDSIIKNESKFSAGVRWLGERTHDAQLFTDDLTLQPIFRGVVEQGIENGLTPQKAVARAEMLVENAIGSGRKYDLSNFLNAKEGSVAWYMNGLQQFTNALFNRCMRAYYLTEADFKNYPMAVSAVGGGIFISALLGDLLAFRSPLNDDEELSAERLAKWAIGSTTGLVSGMFPFFGDGLNALGKWASDEPYYGMRNPSPLSDVAQFSRAELKILNPEASMEDKLESLARAGSMARGIPIWFTNLFFNVYDILGNDMSPQLRDLIRRRPADERER